MMDITYGWNIIGEIETVHVCTRATCIRPPPIHSPSEMKYYLFKSQTTKTQIASQWANRMQEI